MVKSFLHFRETNRVDIEKLLAIITPKEPIKKEIKESFLTGGGLVLHRNRDCGSFPSSSGQARAGWLTRSSGCNRQISLSETVRRKSPGRSNGNDQGTEEPIRVYERLQYGRGRKKQLFTVNSKRDGIAWVFDSRSDYADCDENKFPLGLWKG